MSPQFKQWSWDDSYSDKNCSDKFGLTYSTSDPTRINLQIFSRIIGRNKFPAYYCHSQLPNRFTYPIGYKVAAASEQLTTTLRDSKNKALIKKSQS